MAQACPIPLLAPVTSAILPDSSVISSRSKKTVSRKGAKIRQAAKDCNSLTQSRKDSPSRKEQPKEKLQVSLAKAQRAQRTSRGTKEGMSRNAPDTFARARTGGLSFPLCEKSQLQFVFPSLRPLRPFDCAQGMLCERLQL